jgi:hypothetical protein
LRMPFAIASSERKSWLPRATHTGPRRNNRIAVTKSRDQAEARKRKWATVCRRSLRFARPNSEATKTSIILRDFQLQPATSSTDHPGSSTRLDQCKATAQCSQQLLAATSLYDMRRVLVMSALTTAMTALCRMRVAGPGGFRWPVTRPAPTQVRRGASYCTSIRVHVSPGESRPAAGADAAESMKPANAASRSSQALSG